MTHCVTILPENRQQIVRHGDQLLSVLRDAGLSPEAPCGGQGKCGKCRVVIDGREAFACQTIVDRDMLVALPQKGPGVILTHGLPVALPADGKTHLAIDIGTTTVVAYLIENGKIIAVESRKNPQAAYGADVVSRIHYALKDKDSNLTTAIRDCIAQMTRKLLLCAISGQPDTICIVGNSAMQQLFLGLSVENLTQVPYTPLLTKTIIADGGDYIPDWAGAKLLIVPDISGYIGADTIACILATGMDRAEQLTLLVDIGTNGEMVLGNKHGLVACATAAGPALEGAQIHFGMQAADGAIDRVESGFLCHCIGGGNATGICGSGLLDAVSVALEQGLINQRGRIMNESRTLPLVDGIFLTQEDIRQLQQAKGAIAAGIRLMAQQLGVSLTDIEKVYLAGAFGSFMDPHSACRIGLIPSQLEDKIQPVGNAAGSGAMQIACSRDAFARTDAILSQVEHLDLATLPDWAGCFARSMRFETEEEFWCSKAQAMGFTYATVMDTAKLTARQDVRDMCAADKCRAYGKNWTCPPHCGTLEDCQSQMHRFRRGILVQTVGITQKSVDTRAYRETEQQHLLRFYALADAIKAVHPQALPLGSGGCRICPSCAHPDPCRFPEKACASMEAYGLFVTDVCRDNDLRYHHGEKTVTYTACVLF